jgi:protein phosphatase
MIRAGKLTQEQAKDFPHKGVVTRAIGVLEEVKVECQSLIPEHGDVFLLCSDGLHGMLDDLKIETLLKSGSSLDQVAQSLVDAANAAGGNDNIAVVLVRTTWTRLKDGKS